MRWMSVISVCFVSVFFTVQALGQTAIVTTPTTSQTVTQPTGTTLSINSLTIPGTLSIQGDRTAMIQQTQTAQMPDGSPYDIGGITLISNYIRDTIPSIPAAYMKIRSINTYSPFPTNIRGTQIEFGTVNGLNGQGSSATTAMTIDPDGLVGIGTLTPQNPLSLLYGINVDQNDQNPGFMFRNAQQSFGLTFGDSSGEGIGSARVAGSPNHYGLDFFTSFQNRLSITSSGAVGINTNSPSSTLEVNGSIALTSGSNGQIIFQDGTRQSTAAAAVPPNLGSLPNGNVGIGASNPASLLQVGQWQTQGDLTLWAGAASAGATSKLAFDMTVAGGYGTSEIGSIRSMSYQNGGHNQLLFNVGAWNNNNVSSPIMTLQDNGSLGIGTTTPGAALEVNGNVKLTSGSGSSVTFADGTVQTTAYVGTSCPVMADLVTPEKTIVAQGGDYAESVDVGGDRTSYEPGDVMVIGVQESVDVAKSTEAYSTRVAGIYSTKPGYVGRRQAGDSKTGNNEIPMAMIGIVPTKVSAENGAIHRGDLLVSSSQAGYAMKGTDRSRMVGAVVGKAMGSLESDKGIIEVLVTLQ